VEVLPQASVAVHVLVCEKLHPLVTTAPSLDDSVGVPQASVAVADPSAAFIVAEDGLQVSITPLAGVPDVVIVGGVTSAVQVAVRDAVEVFPQTSIAVHVLVCEREHPLLCTAPSEEVSVGVLHASVAVALPNAALIAEVDGLQPRTPLAGLPDVVIVGAVTSNVQVAVRDVLLVLPQPSVAVHDLVCERPQPLLCTAPSTEVMVGVPQASVAVAVPNAPFIAAVDGLHPSASVPPVAVSVGAVISNVHVAVRDVVAVLPQPSVAVHVLVCARPHPVLTIAPSVDVTVGVPQASVAVAVPNAPFIAAVDGLHPSSSAPPVAVSVGAVISNVHVTVREVVETFPQPSVAVHVLVCERPQPLL
jgi:hypothetical protein